MAEAQPEKPRVCAPEKEEKHHESQKKCQLDEQNQQEQHPSADKSASLPPPQVHQHHARSEGRNEQMEDAVRKALEGPGKDLGRLCKILGEAFCLPSPGSSARSAGYDSGSDTTSPADQDQSSSESGNHSELGGDAVPLLVAGQGDAISGENQTKKYEDGDVRAVAAAAKIPADLLASAWSALFSWRSALSEGDLLDVYNSLEGEWYLSKVVPLDPDDECELEETSLETPIGIEGGGKAGREEAETVAAGVIGASTKGVHIRIHYQGWPVKYDETFRRDSPSLQPAHTHTKRPKKAERKKRVKVMVDEKQPLSEVIEWVREDEFGNVVARGIVGQDDPYEEACNEGKAPEQDESGATVNRYGRKVVPRVNLAQSKSKGNRSGSDADAGGEGVKDLGREGEGNMGEGHDTEKQGKKRTNRFVAEGGGAMKTPDDWICGMCSQLDTPCMSDMVTCDGPCLRSFHVVCLDVDEEALSKEKWFCEDCERGYHVCWQCGDEGQDNVMGGVFRCSVNNCGRFYHRHCVELNANSVIKADLDEGEDGHPVFKFRCGYHICDTCSSKSGGIKNHLYKCFKCPTSYHLNCIPPDARYHELALLCGDHPEVELPALKQGDSVLVEEEVLEESGKGEEPASFALQNLKLPKVPPKAEQKSDIRHFRLPSSILNSYYSKPPPFQHICAMQFIAPRPPRVDPTPVCNCTGGTCGESCLNAMLRTECVCGNGIRARYQNCKQGADCGNRRLQNRVFAKVAPFREPGMGWGLKVVEDLPKGSLVGEYVGEVIDEATVEHRMSEQRRLHPNDGEFYIMELGQSLFVDAKGKGNLMRLINHSCNPNCDVQAWNIAGYTRLGIYATKDLVKGESLSYDYKFSTNETAKFKCMCGAANCRGTLAPKSREDDSTEDGSKLKGRARKEMLQKRERMAKNRQARSQLGQLVTSKRLSLTGRVLPGDKTAEVKAGPPSKYFGFARDQRIFLVRNARAGADLLTRKRLLENRAKVHAKRIAFADPSHGTPTGYHRAGVNRSMDDVTPVAYTRGVERSGAASRRSTPRTSSSKATGSAAATSSGSSRKRPKSPINGGGANRRRSKRAALTAPSEASDATPPKEAPIKQTPVRDPENSVSIRASIREEASTRQTAVRNPANSVAVHASMGEEASTKQTAMQNPANSVDVRASAVKEASTKQFPVRNLSKSVVSHASTGQEVSTKQTPVRNPANSMTSHSPTAQEASTAHPPVRNPANSVDVRASTMKETSTTQCTVQNSVNLVAGHASTGEEASTKQTPVQNPVNSVASHASTGQEVYTTQPSVKNPANSAAGHASTGQEASRRPIPARSPANAVAVHPATGQEASTRPTPVQNPVNSVANHASTGQGLSTKQSPEASTKQSPVGNPANSVAAHVSIGQEASTGLTPVQNPVNSVAGHPSTRNEASIDPTPVKNLANSVAVHASTGQEASTRQTTVRNPANSVADYASARDEASTELTPVRSPANAVAVHPATGQEASTRPTPVQNPANPVASHSPTGEEVSTKQTPEASTKQSPVGNPANSVAAHVSIGQEASTGLTPVQNPVNSVAGHPSTGKEASIDPTPVKNLANSVAVHASTGQEASTRQTTVRNPANSVADHSRTGEEASKQTPEQNPANSVVDYASARDEASTELTPVRSPANAVAVHPDTGEEASSRQIPVRSPANAVAVDACSGVQGAGGA